MTIIELFRYIIYGLIQGFFEVLPISSSGLVSFIQNVTNEQFSNNHFFLMVVNLGSLAAVIIYLRKTIKRLLVQAYKYKIENEEDKEFKKSYEYIINIIIAIIPAGIAGVIYTAYDVELGHYALIVVGVGALLTGTILFSSRNTTERYTNTVVNRSQAWYVGLFQILSIMPGVSRLAITTAAGTHKEMSYETSLTFSLLIYIPISLGTIFTLSISGIIDIGSFNFYWYTLVYYFLSMVVSFFATMLALKYIFIITRKGNFSLFYIFNIVFGLVALVIGLIRF